MPVGQIWGVTTDNAGNIYVVSRPTGGGSGQVTKYDANGVFVAATPIDSNNGDGGYANAIGITYSETSGYLYTSNGSDVEDCISIIDPATMTYVGVGAPAPPGGGTSPKGINIVTECCPVNNNISLTEVLCEPVDGEEFSLQELLMCDGIVCGGVWKEAISNPALSFNNCNNTVTVSAAASLTGCSSFTLQSEGIGVNNQCGAFNINLKVCFSPEQNCINQYGEFTITKRRP